MVPVVAPAIEQNAQSALLFPKSRQETAEQFPGIQKRGLAIHSTARNIRVFECMASPLCISSGASVKGIPYRTSA